MVASVTDHELSQAGPTAFEDGYIVLKPSFGVGFQGSAVDDEMECLARCKVSNIKSFESIKNMTELYSALPAEALQHLAAPFVDSFSREVGQEFERLSKEYRDLPLL
jgi:hypothetical protein